MTRIADGTRTAHVAYTKEYAIGYHNCYACKAETPAPPQAVLDKLALEGVTSTIWPFEQWHPPGWIEIREWGHICDNCARAVAELLKGRRAPQPHTAADDFERLRECASHATALATEALMTDFPPRPTSEYLADHWSHVYDIATRHTYYKEQTLRHRIRQIEAALKGAPIRELFDSEDA